MTGLDDLNDDCKPTTAMIRQYGPEDRQVVPQLIKVIGTLRNIE